MNERKVPEKSIAFYGVTLSLALVLSYVESLLPMSLGVPGAKLGLANLMTVFLLYTAGARAAFSISAARIMLSGFMFGNMFAILYSSMGFLFSFLSMLLLKRSGRFGTVGVSMAGGVMHNVGQLICAAFIAGGYVLMYLPALLLAGIIAGLLIGALGAYMIKRVGRYVL
ncbi:MAG TPA: Gx transporter family protein [Candidatus Avilachnospira avistercoris]|nr:Gx transporter family protein [Candidatus Avilachnospira avistercoris]